MWHIVCGIFGEYDKGKKKAAAPANQNNIQINECTLITIIRNTITNDQPLVSSNARTMRILCDCYSLPLALVQESESS